MAHQAGSLLSLHHGHTNCHSEMKRTSFVSLLVRGTESRRGETGSCPLISNPNCPPRGHLQHDAGVNFLGATGWRLAPGWGVTPPVSVSLGNSSYMGHTPYQKTPPEEGGGGATQRTWLSCALPSPEIPQDLGCGPACSLWGHSNLLGVPWAYDN
jgi:hypothetical protein